jgi:hypothetical protein
LESSVEAYEAEWELSMAAIAFQSEFAVVSSARGRPMMTYLGQGHINDGPVPSVWLDESQFSSARGDTMCSVRFIPTVEIGSSVYFLAVCGSVSQGETIGVGRWGFDGDGRVGVLGLIMEQDGEILVGNPLSEVFYATRIMAVAGESATWIVAQSTRGPGFGLAVCARRDGLSVVYTEPIVHPIALSATDEGLAVLDVNGLTTYGCG